MAERFDSLDEQLKSEMRLCRECGFAAENPFIERCPRCFSILPKAEVDCEGCAHKFLCPTGKNRKLTPH